MSVLTASRLTVGIGATQVLQGLDLQLEAGQCWGLLGLNGSGKTTLLHTLAGLRPQAAGELVLLGRPLAAWPARRLARERGLMPQDTLDPFPMSVLEAVLAGRYPHADGLGGDSAADIAIARAALAELGLADFAERDCATLSGGERRRVACATLLAQQPRLYFLDEPTNHLDPHHQILLLDRLTARRAAGATVVMSLHDPNLAARYCSHVLLLLGEGEALAGPATLLTGAVLTRLYRHPLQEHAIAGGRVFVPG